MKLSMTRDQLLKPLQQVSGVVEKRQTLQVLSNVLMVVESGQLAMTGTDLEVELVARHDLTSDVTDGRITVPCRKLLDICRALPAAAPVDLSLDGARLVLKSGKSRYTLSTLPASDFPNLDDTLSGSLTLSLSQKALKRLIDKTSFAMAQQDVRYYLNGMLFEVTQGRLRVVATDGHRLALCDASISGQVNEKTQVIVPRKGIQELARLLSDDDAEVTLTLGTNHLRVTVGAVTFTSKLIDGRFPDYERVLPKGGDRVLVAGREELKSSLQRASILCNEKFRGVRLQIAGDQLKILATNPDQEEAEEEIQVEYNGKDLEIGFNVGYMLDVLNALNGAYTKTILGDTNSSALVQDNDDEQADALYVVMPMRL